MTYRPCAFSRRGPENTRPHDPCTHREACTDRRPSRSGAPYRDGSSRSDPTAEERHTLRQLPLPDPDTNGYCRTSPFSETAHRASPRKHESGSFASAYFSSSNSRALLLVQKERRVCTEPGSIARRGDWAVKDGPGRSPLQ